MFSEAVIRGLIIFILSLSTTLVSSQQYNTISLQNPSFEDIPAAGRAPSAWYDCGRLNFPQESPPDVQPFAGQQWSVAYEPTDGNTYMGMVVRDNESWEAVSQRLNTPLEPGNCYSFSFDAMQSPVYISYSRLDDKTAVNYNTPAKLRIWGGMGNCQKKELLAETDMISNPEWERKELRIEPKSVLYFIVIEAFYKTPTLVPYNGNILMDNLSDIQQIPCNEEEIVASVEPTVIISKRSRPNPKSEPERRTAIVEIPPLEQEVLPVPREKILPGLTKNNLRLGQTILVEQLHFKADTSTINPTSYASLNEVYDFLNDNPNVRIEVGGHTSFVRDDAYCNKLSKARAKAVADYLFNKGIEIERIVYKGYGKQRPIASNRTRFGREKNQRVEIKILQLDG
ncbi:MAG: OmpA family protein [Bacteroidia bacterium]|nr:OmpA family protein [Bacteroidia bacterium]